MVNVIRINSFVKLRLYCTQVGGTSLMVASMHGHLDIVKLLVQRQADINMRDLNQWNCLMKAADKGNTEVVIFLIQNGAEVAASDNVRHDCFRWLIVRLSLTYPHTMFSSLPRMAFLL